MFDNNDDLSWFGAEFGATKKWHKRARLNDNLS